MKAALGVMVVVLVAMAGVRAARAEAPAWSVIEVRPGEPAAGDRDPPPRIRIKVTGQAAPAPEESARWMLRQVDGRLKAVAPIAVTPYHRSSEPLALVVLVEGHEYYFGNDTYVEERAPDAPAVVDGVLQRRRSQGVHAAIREALDATCDREAAVATGIPCAGPPGSRGAIVVYSAGADVRAPMGDLARLSGEALGGQELQKGKSGRDLAAGLQAATDLLIRTPATRKVLLVISDGFEDGAAGDVRAIERRLDAEAITVLAFQLEVDTRYIDDSREVRERSTATMRQLADARGSAYVRVRSARDLAGRITSAIQEHLGDRFWLEFPGHVGRVGAPTAAGFVWDGREHEAVLLLDDEPVGAPQPLAALRWGQPAAQRALWPWLAIGGALVLVIAVLVLRRGRQPDAIVAAPMPSPVAAPHGPIKPVQAPVTGGRTIVMSMDEIPMVGWLVPINGPNKFQTFKLAPGVTKLGGTPGVAHVVVDDGYVSGDHAHITMTPGGFTLVDNLSANGTYVNERRVDRHDLVDNDMIKLGKTDFKFKTLNA